jgi:hypothetical protein
MSLAALMVVGLQIATHGPLREPDEGTAAHVWQLLMAGQVPFIGFFLIRWLPQAPRAAWPVPVLQLAAALAALAPVYFLHL